MLLPTPLPHTPHGHLADATWYGGRPQPRLDPASPSPQKRGHSLLIFFHVYCGQIAGCSSIPLGTDVGLGTGDIVLDGDPSPPKRGTVPPV